MKNEIIFSCLPLLLMSDCLILRVECNNVNCSVLSLSLLLSGLVAFLTCYSPLTLSSVTVTKVSEPGASSDCPDISSEKCHSMQTYLRLCVKALGRSCFCLPDRDQLHLNTSDEKQVINIVQLQGVHEILLFTWRYQLKEQLFIGHPV